MGDFRADIDLKMTMFGKTYKQNMSINYWDNGDGVDDRIIEFFRESWYDARAKHQMIIDKANRKQKEAEKEEYDKKEYERLKAKYNKESK